MSVTPGTRIGAYEVVSLIGVGGMGEVYRARDLTLDREVALKVLPESFATIPYAPMVRCTCVSRRPSIRSLDVPGL